MVRSKSATAFSTILTCPNQLSQLTVNPIAPLLCQLNPIAPLLCQLNPIAPLLCQLNSIAPVVCQLNPNAFLLCQLNSIEPPLCQLNSIAPLVCQLNSVAPLLCQFSGSLSKLFSQSHPTIYHPRLTTNHAFVFVRFCATPLVACIGTLNNTIPINIHSIIIP